MWQAWKSTENAYENLIGKTNQTEHFKGISLGRRILLQCMLKKEHEEQGATGVLLNVVMNFHI
jgi:hypothetical protein